MATQEFDVEDLGEYAARFGKSGRKGDSDNVWIGAKFERGEENDLEVIDAFKALQAKFGGVKRAIAVCVRYASENVK